VIFENSKAFSQTYDSNHELHSYNDQPALASTITTSSTSSMVYQWFSHGVPYRADGKPFTIVRQNKDKVMTYDENNEYHSFNDQPAIVITNKDNSLNIIVKNYWYSHGYNVREEFKSAVEIVKNGITYRNWSLYEIDISEQSYKRIEESVLLHGSPVWASLLRELQGVSREQFESYLDEERKWQTDLPVEWVLRSWGISNNLRLFIPGDKNSFPTYQPYPTESLLKCIKHEKVKL
jgi:hypothetical protein